MLPSVLWHCRLGGRKGIQTVKNGGWWRWALLRPDGVSPSQMVGVSASVNLPLHHKVQRFSSGTGSPGWSQKRSLKRLWYISVTSDMSRQRAKSDNYMCMHVYLAYLCTGTIFLYKYSRQNRQQEEWAISKSFSASKVDWDCIIVTLTSTEATLSSVSLASVSICWLDVTCSNIHRAVLNVYCVTVG